ncbi:MAG: zinc-ribbon domain-containing protein [Oscillospiraceae bacterium]|nr:zinc-ribbon domain-containing protein [Oscillospiraceae bacterium]
MSLTDSLKKIAAGAVEKGKDLAEQGKQVMDKTVEKGKGLAEQGKLSLENQKQEQAIKEAQQQIGAYVSENNLLAEDEFVLGQMSVIAAAQELIEKNQVRIAELKAAPEKAVPEKEEECCCEKEAECCCEDDVHVCTERFCPKCSAQVRTDAVFCQACGAKL